jgi:hypothetical protein
MSIFMSSQVKDANYEEIDSHKTSLLYSGGSKTYENQVRDLCTFCCAELHDFILYFLYKDTQHDG